MKKNGLSINNLNNLWSYIKVYAVFFLQIYVEKNLCGENISEEKMTNMRSEVFMALVTTQMYIEHGNSDATIAVKKSLAYLKLFGQNKKFFSTPCLYHAVSENYFFQRFLPRHFEPKQFQIAH